jgi:hypothetical protein
MTEGPSFENYLLATVVVALALLLLIEKRRPYRKIALSGLKQSISTNASAFVFNNNYYEHFLGVEPVGHRRKAFALWPAERSLGRPYEVGRLFCAIRFLRLALALSWPQIRRALALP